MRTPEQRQYRLLLVSVLGTGAWLVSLSIIGLTRFWPIVQNILHPSKLACGCAALTITTSWWVNAAAVLGTFVSAGLLIRLTWTMTKSLRRTDREQRALSLLPQRQLYHHRLTTTYTLVETDEVLALTSGLWRPRVFLSTGLLQRLSGREIDAVLHHEAAHQRMRDPLIMAITMALLEAFPWWPKMRSWRAMVPNLRELAADAAATNGYQQTQALAQAFVKLLDQPMPSTPAALSPNRDRLAKLLDHRWRPAYRIWSWASTASLLTVGLAAIFVFRTAHAQVTPPPATLSLCQATGQMCRVETPILPASDWRCSVGHCVTLNQRWSPQYALTLAP